MSVPAVQEIGIRQARVFLAIAECRSITGAARALSRSQTSVTKPLRQLERQVGEKLCERAAKGAQLTAFGERLRDRARDAARAVATAARLVPPAAPQRSRSRSRFSSMDVSRRCFY